ncbi:alpha/beta fold hydrolase [Tepidibacillus decaturensis]|uniref:AB hydrolase-1 domain-containing protein n=1 Tax=Tepidibacillus decaturensis TaxID=1413211 RepID=A0A135L600_9BACI|nr:alpha/beta hydrolase [Tepidibacillus decaturensis]KXG44360.1 hypothetical protein U473_10335 [Tepidibacillus decaturensis]
MVISYDRLGYGWSDDPDQFRTNKRMAIEPEEVLNQLGIDTFILVGHSFGGLNARYLAKQFPNKLKGMVLVDSPHLNQYTLSFPNVHHIGERLVILIFKLLKALSFVGFARLIAKFRWLPKRINDLVEKLPQDIQPILLRQIFSYRSFKTLVNEFSILEKGCKEIGNQSLGGLPLIVISRGFDDLVLPWADRRDKHLDEASWEMMQRKISSLSSKGKWLKAEKSGHMIMLEQPERIVEAIRELVKEVRGEKLFR